MAYLLDVNLLLALAWPNHRHHAIARAWFANHGPSGWATCPITQCGFVRVSCNAKLQPAPVSPRDAIKTLQAMVNDPNHVFWPDDVMFLDSTTVPHDFLMGHRQVTDAYLIGLGRHHGGRLATLDQALLTLLPIAQRNSVTVISVPSGPASPPGTSSGGPP